MKTLERDYHNASMLLITYDSSALKGSEKVRFYYALKGRDGISGVVKLYSIDFLGKGVLLVPYEHKHDIKLFFRTWNMQYKLKEIVVQKGEEVIRDE